MRRRERIPSNMKAKFSGRLVALASAAIITAAMGPAGVSAKAADGGDLQVNIQIFTPKSGNLAGIGSRGFMVDLKADFNVPLNETGAGLELTGPGVHQNAAPLPGAFGDGPNDKFPGLVVLLSSTKAGAGINHAGSFNLVAVTDQRSDRAQIWSTWIIGAPNAFGTVGIDTPTRLLVAAVRGTAPAVVKDMNLDGKFDEEDLEMMGFEIVSQVRTVDFVIKG
jgi:hypothetical protein